MKQCGNEQQMGGRRGLDGCASHVRAMAVVAGTSAIEKETGECSRLSGELPSAVCTLGLALEIFILRVRAGAALGFSYRSSYVGYAPGSNGEKFPIQQSEDGVELCLNLLICVRPLLP